MAFKYSESEKFRANMFFAYGIALCTPFGMNVVYMCQMSQMPKIHGLLISIALFMVGFSLTQIAFNIMLENDERSFRSVK